MKKRNAKTLGMSLALMLVMCVATALLSFSLADNSTLLDAPKTTTAIEFNKTKTNIDYIIQNSNEGTIDESGRDLSIFYVVEIGSADDSSKSPLKSMLTEDIIGKIDITEAKDADDYTVGTDNADTDISQFVKQVINGWSTQNQTMKPNKISYKYFSVSNLKSDEMIKAATTALGKADLVYVSNEPTAQYSVTSTKTVDIPEEIKLYLASVATANYTPFIIDSYTKTNNGGSNGGGSSEKTMTTFAQQVLKKAGYYRNAFSYNVAETDKPQNNDIKKYLNRTDVNSLWLPISGKKKQDNWFRDKDGNATSRVLTISKSGETSVTNKIKGSINTTEANEYAVTNLITDEAYVKNAGLFELTGTPEEKRTAYNDFFKNRKAYKLAGTDFYTYGYAYSQDRPQNIMFESFLCTKEGDTYTLDLSGINLGSYDLIVFEDLSGVHISADDYNTLYSLIYGMQHFVYDSRMLAGDTSTSGDGTTTIQTSSADNYNYVLSKVADANEKSRFSNVLVTSKNEMLIYGAATDPSGVQPIADIINNGAYRGSGGTGSSSNLYTVLEIQPCYPIDHELAQQLQNLRSSFADKARTSVPDSRNDDQDIFYYLRHDSVLNDVTTDEISYDGGITSLTDMKSTDDDEITGKSPRNSIQYTNKITATTAVDYYAWELSKAKIAHITGQEYNKVKVVHMSSVEFDTSRESLKDNYDMIYIGGKNTAFRNITYFAKDGRTNENALVYNMYFRNGGTYSIDGNYAVLSGNDITYNKYKELQEYVAAGMPVVITNAVADAYKDAKTLGYRQRKIDPDSNMYRFLDLVDKTIQKNNGYKENILIGFDPDDQVKIANTGGEYGDTYGGYATVFGGLDSNVYIRKTIQNEQGQNVDVNVPAVVTPSTDSVNAVQLKKLLTSAANGQRPKFTLTQCPAFYVEGDKSTEISSTSLTFKYDCSSREDYRVRVYIDNNTNSIFGDSSEELIYDKPANANKTVTVNLKSDFDGGVYWKFEIVAGECSSSTTGLSKVTVKKRNYVNVLQIVPVEANAVAENNKMTLLFCTECQQARGILRGNRYSQEGKYSEHCYTGSTFSEGGYDPGGSLPIIGVADPGYSSPSGSPMGVHVHNFGIVKYDSHFAVNSNTVGADDWQTNWAYDVYKDYDVDMDILTTRDFEKLIAEVTSTFETLAAKRNANNEIVRKADGSVDIDSDKAEKYIGDYGSLAEKYKAYYQTMKAVIDGSVKTDSEYYRYLKNKITKSNTVFSDDDLKSFFGETADEYKLETAKGGLSQSGTGHTYKVYKNSNLACQGAFVDGQGLDLNAVNNNGTLSASAWVNDDGVIRISWAKYDWAGKLSGSGSDVIGSIQLSIDDKNISLTAGSEPQGETILAIPNTSSDIYAVPASYDLEAAAYAQLNLDSFLTALADQRTTNMDKCTLAELKQEVAYETFYHRYSDFFSLSNSHDDKQYVTYDKWVYEEEEGNYVKRSVTSTEKIYDEYKKLYVPWRDAKVLEQYFYKMYMKYLIFSNLKETDGKYLPDLTPVYSCIVIGVAENFGNDDIRTADALNTIKQYVKNDGNTFIFHQTINDSGSTVNMTAALKDLFGQNYNHLTNVTNQKAETITFGAGSSETLSKNFYSSLLLDTRTEQQKAKDIEDETYSGPSINLSPIHRTMVNEGVWGTNEKETRFIYTQSALLYSDTQVPNTHKKFDAEEFKTKSFTNRATQTNKGLVTMYPFLIASQLKIGQTHPNTFSTDIEDNGVIVYYALAGGQQGNQSSLVAADPQDGIDNYWLYSKGSVTYCGAGHSAITGIHVDNNDERRLFINIILNSSRKSAVEVGPVISVFDPDPVGGEYINSIITMTEDNIYQMTVPNLRTDPEFTYLVTLPDTTDDVEEVKIFYDKSNNTSGDEFGYVEGTDVEIYHNTVDKDAELAKDVYKLIGRDKKYNLKLDEEYFKAWDGSSACIVISIKTRNGKYATQRIIVKLAPRLWDLT